MMLSSIFLIALAFLGVLIIIAFLWVFHLLEKNHPQVQEDPYENLTEQDKIIELHKQALVYGDFDALQELVREFAGPWNIGRNDRTWLPWSLRA